LSKGLIMALKTSPRIAIRLLAVVVIIFLSYTILSDIGLFSQRVREVSPAGVSLNPVGAKQEAPPASHTEEVIGAYGFSDLLESSPGASDSTFAPKVVRGESGALTRERSRQKQKAPSSDTDESANVLAATAHPSPASPPPVPPPAITTPPKNDESRASEDESVVVVKRVENGRVVEAHVSNPQPGREASENSALRIVRQRRYQSGVTVTEAERIRIKKQ